MYGIKSMSEKVPTGSKHLIQNLFKFQAQVLTKIIEVEDCRLKLKTIHRFLYMYLFGCITIGGKQNNYWALNFHMYLQKAGSAQ